MKNQAPKKDNSQGNGPKEKGPQKDKNNNDAPVKPEKEIPVKPDKNPDPTKPKPGITDPERADPTRIEEPEKHDPTRIDKP